jgi:hypothetical protein
MFLNHVISLRNITTYDPQPGHEAEDHKVGPYVPQPVEEHKRPICEPLPFFCSSTLSSFFCAPLPALRSPHASATPAPHSPRAGHPGSTPTVLGRPCPTLPNPASPASAARVRPVSPCLPSPTPDHSSPSATSCLPRGGPIPQRASRRPLLPRPRPSWPHVPAPSRPAQQCTPTA